MKVIKDKNGKVINIGEWDYMVEERMDNQKNIFEIIKNPMPEGAYEADAEVAVGEDGGLYVVTE